MVKPDYKRKYPHVGYRLRGSPLCGFSSVKFRAVAEDFCIPSISSVSSPMASMVTPLAEGSAAEMPCNWILPYMYLQMSGEKGSLQDLPPGLQTRFLQCMNPQGCLNIKAATDVLPHSWPW